MPEQYYERLSFLDGSFLALESRTTHMHVAGAAVFEAEPLTKPDGGIDINKIKTFIESKLQYVPRYRQHLAWVPIEKNPARVPALRPRTTACANSGSVIPPVSWRLRTVP